MSDLRYSDCLDARSQAAYWLTQKRSGDMSAYDVHSFQLWFERDPANRDAYRRMEKHWELLGSLAQDPEIMASREHDAQTFDRPSHLRHIGAAVACAVLAATASWTLFTSGLLPHPPHAPAERPLQTFATKVGQSALLTLPDGSVVTLDTDSAMRLKETAGQRLVFLDRGRAYFKVAKDASRPFIVAAAGRTVRATGTAFDVRLDPGAVTVTLVEGKVRVEQPKPGAGAPPKRVDMTAGGQLVASDDQDWSLSPVDLDKEMSWLNGRLSFFHDPLSHAVTEVNRYSVRKVVFRDGRVPDKHIVGVFQAGDTESFAKAVEMYHLARITAITDDRIELTAVQR